MDGHQSLGRSLLPGLFVNLNVSVVFSASTFFLRVSLRCSSVGIGVSCVLGIVVGLIVCTSGVACSMLLLGVSLRCSSVGIGGSCVLGMVLRLIVHSWDCIFYE